MESEIEIRSNPLSRGLIAIAALLLTVGVAAGYGNGLRSVTLSIDGQSRRVHTHQDTVATLLIDAGVDLYPEDIVTPDLDQPVQPEMSIEVTRAQPVVVEADGRVWRSRTHNTTTAQILEAANITLAIHDQVQREWQTLPNGDQLLRLSVRRAIPITIHDNGQTTNIYSTAPTVGEALQQTGLTLYLADFVEPDLGQPLTPDMHIYLERSRPVTVNVDGRVMHTRTHRELIDQVLGDLGIVLTGLDYTNPPLDQPLEGDTTIHVIRVTERFLIEQEPIPFQVVMQADPTLELDNQRLIQDGAAGVRQRRIRVRYENGQEISRTAEDEYVVVPPVTKIIGYGTNIVVRQLDTPSGPIEYWRVIRVLATSYSASTAGTPRTSPYYGITRLGWVMRHGIVAVDPDLISLRTNLYIPGYGLGVAGDTGGAINGRRVDLGYDDDNLVLWYRWVDVYLLTPVPPADEINFILEY